MCSFILDWIPKFPGMNSLPLEKIRNAENYFYCHNTVFPSSFFKISSSERLRSLKFSTILVSTIIIPSIIAAFLFDNLFILPMYFVNCNFWHILKKFTLSMLHLSYVYILIPRIVHSLHMLFRESIWSPVILSILVSPRKSFFIIDLFFKINIKYFIFLFSFNFEFLFIPYIFLLINTMFSVLSCENDENIEGSLLCEMEAD